MGYTHFSDVNLAIQVADGASAGDVSVSGIEEGDTLKAVLNLTDAEDLTDEFEIDSDGTINNSGGTSTDGDVLLVYYVDKNA